MLKRLGLIKLATITTAFIASFWATSPHFIPEGLNPNLTGYTTFAKTLAESREEVETTRSYLLKPDRVFDGKTLHTNWQVLVQNDKIIAAGPQINQDQSQDAQPDSQTGNTTIIPLPGMTLMPGLIDAHSHVLLHPYDEVSWTDQVLKESTAERSIRAANHLKATLMSGFTTLRDLGSEGAGYADIGVRQTLEKGVIPGPRLLVAGPAIVATGSYGPKGFHEGVRVPLGANEADGHDNLISEVRRQIGGGVDWVKVYADYRWGPNGEAKPTFSVEELKLIVETARTSGRDVVAHASTDEAMRRAIEAGVKTIEHGDNGTLETYRLMAKNGVAICPTLGAVEAISSYRGWDGSEETVPARIIAKRQQMETIIKAKTNICNGSDVGVFDHGDNAWEIELLVEYGVSPLNALKAATSGNAKILRMEDTIGSIAQGLSADLIAVAGNPLTDITALRRVPFVMQAGHVIKKP